MKTLILFVIISFALCLDGCSKSTGPVIGSSSYVPFNFGDIRQIIFVADSSAQLMKVVRAFKRTDGQDIFEVEWTTGSFPPDTSYYLLRDNYFMSTNLDTSSYYPGNPFGEQRLAKTNPTIGETWKHTLGSTDSTFFAAVHYDETTTFAGSFSNVFAFVLTETVNGHKSTILVVFYAPDVGYIGTSISESSNLTAQVSYIKVNGREYGTLWPARNPSLVSTRALRSIGIFGERTQANQSLNLTEPEAY